MLNFKTDFYEKIFASLDNNAVLMRVTADGDYLPRRKTPSFSYGDISRTLTFKTNKCKIKI